MDCFKVQVLGCGSAKPTLRHLPTAQVVNFRDKLFLIDCGEGTQLELCRYKIPVNRIGHIFISHLHGDHCFGLIGLLSTLGLSDRTGEVVIHAQSEAETVFRPMLDYFCRDLPYKVRFAPFDYRESQLIYEDKNLQVFTIPLHHRVPTAGFLFQEKERPRHLNADKVHELGIPVAYYRGIKAGLDWVAPDGKVYANDELTTPATKSKSYAYCSDTMYAESIIPIIKDVDLLYHESTYMNECAALARSRTHSTALQAATIAAKANANRLIIGHYSARYDDLNPMLEEAKSVFQDTILAREGLMIEV